MPICDTLIRNVCLVDGTGTLEAVLDVAIEGERILEVGSNLEFKTSHTIEGRGLTLSPGFIDVHTHDDLSVLRAPEMIPKISQGVTTVIVGNCGISAAPVEPRKALPDPMNLLGTADEFLFPTFQAYIEAIDRAQPAVNVAALAGHTSLRANHMSELDRPATQREIYAMRSQLKEALDCGALGLSTGLAYLSANAATTDEVFALAELLVSAHAVYATHMRTESDGILDAMEEAFSIGSMSRVPVVLSHLKCAGLGNWGRSGEVLSRLDLARLSQQVGCDCYPYSAGSSTLDLRQVDDRVPIRITWSDPHPAMAGQSLEQIASIWEVSQLEAARRLQPAGAIYHSISEGDMRRILQHPATMIGSDGLPNDPRPHPRLWGTFPRVLGHYCREEKLFDLSTAIYKMTGMPAARFGLEERGFIREGYYADLVLFDSARISDKATYDDPKLPATGIEGVWVNGVLSFTGRGPSGMRAGRYLRRGKTDWIQ